MKNMKLIEQIFNHNKTRTQRTSLIEICNAIFVKKHGSGNEDYSIIDVVEVGRGDERHIPYTDVNSIIRNYNILNADGVVITHNHPSWVVRPIDRLLSKVCQRFRWFARPSRADIEFTYNVICNVLKPYGINVLDNMIITENYYYSFSENSSLIVS
jgi:hypothetical protein